MEPMQPRADENNFLPQINDIFKVSANGMDPFMLCCSSLLFMYFMAANKLLMAPRKERGLFGEWESSEIRRTSAHHVLC